jgi:arylsulfatase A
VACMMDLLPTIAGLAGAKAPADRVIDGKDIAALLLSADAKSPREAYFYHASQGPLQAVRSGKWKLHLPRKERVQQKDVDRPAELYDLSADVGETKNVAAEHPDVVERLTKLCQAHRQDLQKNARPVGRVGPPSTQPAKDRGASDPA